MAKWNAANGMRFRCLLFFTYFICFSTTMKTEISIYCNISRTPHTLLCREKITWKFEINWEKLNSTFTSIFCSAINNFAIFFAFLSHYHNKLENGICVCEYAGYSLHTWCIVDALFCIRSAALFSYARKSITQHSILYGISMIKIVQDQAQHSSHSFYSLFLCRVTILDPHFSGCFMDHSIWLS